ncbi:TPA: hypothetical protein EYM26_12045 [Candidatus Poribacteria bacterium]|nr:hypothetical protein [Candidatus Poribacteria bacterium]
MNYIFASRLSSVESFLSCCLRAYGTIGPRRRSNSFKSRSAHTRKKIRPIILVMIDENPKGFYDEIFWNTELVDKYSLMLVKELIPFIDRNYRTIQTSESRMNFGISFSGYISLLTTIQHSNIFSRVSCQSSVYWAGEREKRIKDLIAQTSTKSIEIYMD